MPPPETTPIHASVDPAVVTAALAELEGSSDQVLEREYTAIEGTLSAAFTAAGDDLDLSLIENVEGVTGSLAERATAIVGLHSRLTAVQQLQQGRAALSGIRSAILDTNGPAAVVPGEPAQPAAVARVRASALFIAAAREQGIDNVGQYVAANQANALAYELDMDPREYLAATVTTTAGWDPFVTRQPGFTPAISRPIQILDILPMSMTMEHSIKYMIQTTRAPANAIEKAEGAASGEVDMAWTERSEDIREIPAHIPVTEVQLEDVAQIEAIIDEDLRLMVRQRADGQVMNGNGVAPNVAGFLLARHGQAVTDYDWTKDAGKRSDQIGDLRKGKTKVKLAGRCMPNVYLVHDNIWDEIALKDTAGSGYYLGSPASDFVERLWGLPVVPTDHLSDGDGAGSIGAVVMDTMYTRLWIRRGIHSEIGRSGTDFVQRRLTIRAGMRLGVQVRRPQTISTFTM